MLNIEINSKEYNIPNKWEEMTVDYYCGIYEIIKKYQITEEEANSDNDLTKYHIMQENKMYKELFIYMTGIDAETMANVPMKDVMAVIECLNEIMEEYKPKGMDYFEFEGDIYYFPMDFLRTGTFGDYIESQQLELNTQYLKNGRFDILPEQMAILCKQVDEEVDLDNIDEKAKISWINNGHRMGVQFFFEQTNFGINQRYKNLFRDGGTKSIAVAKASKIMKPFGWLNTLYDLALDGVFTRDGKDAMQSVKDEKLYKVLTYLSWKTAKGDYELAVNEEQRKQIK